LYHVVIMYTNAGKKPACVDDQYVRKLGNKKMPIKSKSSDFTDLKDAQPHATKY